MATGEAGDRPANVGGAFGFATQAADTMTGEFADAGIFDRTDIHNAGDLAEYKRGKIESDHQGMRGAVSSLYSSAGLGPSYQSEMDILTEAEDYAHTGDTRSAADIDSQRTRMGLQQLRTQMDAAHSELQAELNAGERKIDPNDTEKVKQFENISAQSLANFDANATRQGKYREAQTNDQISAFQEEAKESQLRAQGRTDDARTAALDFSTQQRVESLQEQADAETDPTHKAQLQREIAAASDTGKIERDSLQQELHRTQMTNVQASAMSAASQMGVSGLQGIHDGGGSNLNDAVRKLDDATMKLNKALSHSKTLVLVKD